GRAKLATCKAELLANDLRAHPPAGERKRRLANEPFFIREAHVIELHSAETEVHGFSREIGRILPDPTLVRVEPWLSILVQPWFRWMGLSLYRTLHFRAP